MTDFVPDSQGNSFEFKAAGGEEEGFDVSLHIQQLCRGGNSGDKRSSSLVDETSLLGSLRNHQQGKVQTQPLGVSTPFGGTIQAPDLSSLNEEGKYSFSCLNLSLGDEPQKQGQVPNFIYPSADSAPSQIKPTSPSNVIMGPPLTNPQQAQQQQQVEENFIPNSIQLSIPNHFDDNGDLLSLPGVLGMNSQFQQPQLPQRSTASQTPRLERSTVGFDSMSNFETPVLPGGPASLKVNMLRDKEQESRSSVESQQQQQQQMELLNEDYNNSHLGSTSPIIGSKVSDSMVPVSDDDVDLQSSVKKTSSLIKLEYKTSQPNFLPLLTTEIPKEIVPMKTEAKKVPNKLPPAMSEMERLKKYAEKSVSIRNSPVRFVSLPSSHKTTAQSAFQAPPPPGPEPNGPYKSQSAEQVMSGGSNNETQDTLIISNSASQPSEILNLRKEYERISRETARKKNLDELKRPIIQEMNQAVARRRRIIEDDDDDPEEEEDAEDDEDFAPPDKTVEKSYLTLKGNELRRKQNSKIVSLKVDKRSAEEDLKTPQHNTPDKDQGGSSESSVFPPVITTSDNVVSSPTAAHAVKQSDRMCQVQDFNDCPSFTPGDQVWAPKKGYDSYFSGTVMTILRNEVYGVEFDDQTKGQYQAKVLRSFVLEPGDPVEVLFGGVYVKAVLHKQQSQSPKGYFLTIEMNGRKKLVGPMQSKSMRLTQEEMDFLFEKENILTQTHYEGNPAVTAVQSHSTVRSAEDEEYVVKVPSAPSTGQRKSAKRKVSGLGSGLDSYHSSDNESDNLDDLPRTKAAVRRKKIKNAPVVTTGISSVKTRPKKSAGRKKTGLIVATAKSPIPASVSSLVVSAAKKQRLFHQYQFLLTCIGIEKNGKNNELERVKELIIEYGGDIVEIDDLDRNKRIKETILLSAKPSRTTKFFLALAKNLKRVHVSWIDQCTLRSSMMPFEKYYLSNGLNDEEEEVKYENKNNIFLQKVIYLSAQKTSLDEKTAWQKMIQSAQGTIAYKQNDAKIDYYVAMNDEVPAKKPKSAVYISKEWLCQCLIQQTLLPTDSFRLTVANNTTARNKSNRRR